MTRLFTSAKSSQRNRGSTPSTRQLESAPYLTIGQTHLITNIATMQHSAGNRAVHGLLHGNAPPLGQTATGTGLPMMESGDAYERESDDPEFFYRFSVEGYAIGINILLYSMTH